MRMNVTIEGTAPLLMNNGRGADPMHEATKKLKELSQTRSKDKTEEVLKLIAQNEMNVKLYLNSDGVPYIPELNIEACILRGARKYRDGKLASAGLRVVDAQPLEYDGPKTFDGLLADERFQYRCGFKQGQVRVYKVRPMFTEWKQTFTVEFDTSIISAESLVKYIKTAGIYVGIGDWRPRHGCFSLVSYDIIRDELDDMIDSSEDVAANDDGDANAAA